MINQFSNLFSFIQKKKISFKSTKTSKKRNQFRNEKSIFKVIFKDYDKIFENLE